jgi:diketogulonate reductase-like aldo/keto reductase
MGVLSYSPLAGGWLSGHYRQDATQGPASVARQRLANRFDLDLPENQRKLDEPARHAQLADDAGITLIELAIAFGLRHPAITAAIIGPRTIEHLESQLTATDVHLTDDVLDRIDQIVAPGLTLNPADNGWSAQPTARPRAAADTARVPPTTAWALGLPRSAERGRSGLWQMLQPSTLMRQIFGDPAG